jgi:hypothetical protein
MKKLSYLLMTSLAGALFVGAVGSTGGCSSSSGGTGGSTGTGGSGGAGANPLVVSATGFVSDSVTGVVGPWYSYADSIGSNASLANGDDIANSDCVKKGGFDKSACTMVTSPLGGQPFVPTDMDSSKMCTTGTGAKVINGTNGPDYSDLWGGGIALDLNNPGGDAGAKGDFDLSAYSGVQFDFSGDIIPNAAMRVNFPFTGEHGTDSPYWMGDTNTSSPLKAGHITVNWADVGGPAYLKNQVPPTTPPKFDSTKTQSIQFQVFTNVNTTTPYSFCVANLALIPKSP